MTDQLNASPSPVQDELVQNPSVTKEQVAKYLLAHPSFLTDNPDLLVQIQVQLQQQGVVSLTQLQSSQSREKIQQLKSRLEQIVANARKNEFIYNSYAQLNLALASAGSIAELQSCLTTHLVGTLGLEAAQIVLLENADGSLPLMSEIQQRSIFDKKLARGSFYFGRVGSIEKSALFPNASAESVALVLLSDSGSESTPADSAKPSNKGLLAIASKDPLHFQPEMDTVLLDYLRKNLNVHINRLR